MVDVLSTRMQAIYNPWEANHQPNGSLSPYVLLEVARKRMQRESERRQTRVATAQFREEVLAISKKKPWLGFPSRPKISKTKSHCKSCFPNVQEEDESRNEQDFIDLLPCEEDKSGNFLVRYFAVIVNHLRKITDYRFPVVFETVLSDERVQDAIAESTSDILSETTEGEPTQETYKKVLLSQARKAKQIVIDMHAALSNFSLMITSFLVHVVTRRCMTSVIIHPSQMEMIRDADKTKLPVIFLPLHRSHMDYIFLIYILYNGGVRVPLTAAGINLKIPFFGPMLRSLGAFYIKRRIEPSTGSKDTIYRAALHTYIVQCLKAGHNLKFYIEGGRTRTGKPYLPKVGLLSVIVDAYMEGSVEDALLVPVSANYDKLVDGNFIRELLGEPKQKESFTSAIRAIWATMNRDHGAARVDFHKPYSLKELVASFQKAGVSPPTLDHALTSPTSVRITPPVKGSIPTSASLFSLHGTDVVSEDHRLLVENIATHIVFDCASFCPLMSTNLLSFLLLNKCRSGVKFGVLVEMFDELRRQLVFSNRELGFCGSSVDVTNAAIALLGPGLIKRVRPEDSSEWDEIITPVTLLPNVIEISYYGNALLPHYAVRSVIATTVFAMTKQRKEDIVRDVRLNERDLIEHSLDLCEVLQFEFIFCKPCQDLESVLLGTIHDMKTDGIFSSDEPALRIIRNRELDLDIDSEASDSDEELSPNMYGISSDIRDLQQLRLYKMVLSPLIDSYVATVIGLRRLINRELTENDFVKEVISEIKTHLETGFTVYGECCSADSIKNACRILKKWCVLESFTKDSIKLIYLSDAFNNKEAVEDLISRISVYKSVD